VEEVFPFFAPRHALAVSGGDFALPGRHFNGRPFSWDAP
jgi:hypothetical protein